MKITVPTSWSEVSIKQFRQLLANEADKTLSEIDIKASHISVLSGADYSDIENLPPKKIDEIFSKISFISSNKIDAKEKFPNVIKLGDKIFYCEPRANMVYGQYKALREWTKSKDSINDNLHNAVALFLHEPNKPYNYEFEEKAKLVQEHLKMNVVFHVTGFFLKLHPELLKATQNYSLSKAEKIIAQTKQRIDREILTETTKPTLRQNFLGLFSRRK